MTNLYTTLFIVFFLTTVSIMLLLPYLSHDAAERRRYLLNKIEGNLDAIFVSQPKKWTKKILYACAPFFCALGFVFPSSFSGLDALLLDNAVKLNKQGYYDQSILLLSEVDRNVSPLMHNELGVAYLGVNDVDAAISNFQTAIELLPEYALAHLNLATAYEIAGRYTDSEFELKRAEDLSKFVLDDSLIYGQSTSATGSWLLRVLFALIFLWVGLKMPIWVTNFLKKRRQKRFESELPDALKLLGNGLKAGMSLQQSLELLVERTKGPVRQEFALVLKEQQLGRSISDAIKNLSVRMPSEDTRILANTVSLLLETGGDMPFAIENVGSSIRERKRVRQKISAMTAEGRAQAFMLAAIPIVVGFIMNWLQKETFSLMYTTMLGWVCLIGMFIWGAIGIFLMWKAIQVKI